MFPNKQSLAGPYLVFIGLYLAIPTYILYRWKAFDGEATQILKTGDKNQILPFLQKKGRYIAEIDLSFPGFNSQDLQEIVKHCPHLKKIKLNQSQVDDSGLAYLSNLLFLEHLELKNCHRITDAGIQSLNQYKYLKTLDLEDCFNLSDLSLAHLQSFTQLQSLNLNKCHDITDTGIKHLQSMTSLRELNLSNCRHITNTSLFYLSKNNALMKLYLKDCCINDSGLSLLENFPLILEFGLISLADAREISLNQLRNT